MSQSISQTMLESARIRLDLIRTELEVGMTFAQIALQSKAQPEKRTRNIRNARTAYETVLRLAGQASMPDGHATDFLNRVALLKADLEALGEANLP